MANNTAEETISNMRTVRAFTNEEKMKGLYNKDINSSYFLGRKIAFLQGEVVVCSASSSRACTIGSKCSITLVNFLNRGSYHTVQLQLSASSTAVN